MIKKKIVFGYDNWIVGGVENILLGIMEHLESQYEIFLLIPTIDKTKDYFELPATINLVEIDCAKGLFAQRIIEFCKLNKIDLFIGSANLNVDQLLVYKGLKESGIKSIMMNHYAWMFPYTHEIFMSKELEARNAILDYPDVILFLTSFSALLCSANANRTTCVMPNPNTFEFDREIPFEERKDIILTVARYDDSEKRLDKILSIFSKVYEKNPNVMLKVVGKVDYKKSFGIELEDELKHLNIPKHAISFEGVQKDVAPFYKEAKVFLFASEFEGFGLVLNEAGINGLPIVTNYFLGIDDLVVHDRNGYFFENNLDSDLAATYVLSLLNDGDLWTRCSKNAMQMAKQFSKSEILKRWDVLVDVVLNEGDLESKLIENKYYVDRNFTNKEINIMISQYEHIISDAINRLNRADAAQDYLNSIYLEEKSYDVRNISVLKILKECIKRCIRKVKNVVAK